MDNYYSQGNYAGASVSIQAGSGEVYITKQQKRKAEIFKIIGIIGAVLLIFSPFLNFATIHLRASANSQFSGYVSEGFPSLYELFEEDEEGTGESEVNQETEDEKSVRLNYGLDLFELRLLGSNFTSLKEYSASDMKAFVQGNEELRDELVYNMYWELFGLYIDESGIEEALEIINFSALGYLALCFVPFIMIISGIMMLIFSVIDGRVGKIIFSIIASAGFIWLFISSKSFLAIIGPGAIVMVIGIITCLVCAFGSLSVKRRKG